MFALVFYVGPHRLALDARRVKEVLPRVQLKPLVGSPACLAGAFVYRGRVVPVVDLHRLLGAGECPAHLSSRIILVPAGGEDRLLGLLAAQVDDVRHLDDHETTSLLESNGPLGSPVSDKEGLLHPLELDRLVARALPGAWPVPALGVNP
jgi:chemotaxis signal transduction protein